MPLVAHNPTDRVEQLIMLTERLSSVIDKETQILAERRPRELEPLQAEKNKLAALYAQEIRAIAADRRMVEGVEPALTERLKTFTQSFEEKAATQKRVLDRARRVTEGAIKALADDVAKRRRPFAGYGAQAVPAMAGAAQPTSLTLNEVV